MAAATVPAAHSVYDPISNVVPFPYSRARSWGNDTNTQWGVMIAQYKLYVRHQTRSASTIRIRDHYIDLLSRDFDVTTVTESQLETWLHTRGWAETSTNSALSSIRHFYKWANRYGHIQSNPAAEIRRLREPRRMGRMAQDDVIVRSMMRAPLSTRVMIMLGAECGLRRGEIARVHRNDIDGEWLYVIGKGGHQRSVHLSEDMLELLEKMPERGWLFPSPRKPGPINPDAVYDRIRRAVGVNAHSLRHRAGTAVYEGTGNNLRVAQEFLGHATPEMTARYVHITRSDLRLASKAARLAA